MGGMRGRRFSSVTDIPRTRMQEHHVQEFQGELAELDEDVLGSMEIRKQDAVERAMDHSRDDLPRLKRLAAANKHSWLPASTKLEFINALLPARSGDSRLPQSLHTEALRQEAVQLQQQIAQVTIECQAEKELFTGKKLQTEIETLVAAVVAAFEAYSQQRPEAERLLQEALHHVDSASRPTLELPPMPDCASEDELRRLLAVTAEEAQSLEQVAADNQAACAQLWQDMEVEEQRLVLMGAQVTQLSEEKEAAGAHEARFRLAAAKAKHLHELQSEISGIRAEVRQTDIIVHLAIHQDCRLQEGDVGYSYQLQLQLPEDDTPYVATQCVVAVLSPATVSIDDILAHAAPGWAGMSSVVHETQRRLRDHYDAKKTADNTPADQLQS